MRYICVFKLQTRWLCIIKPVFWRLRWTGENARCLRDTVSRLKTHSAIYGEYARVNTNVVH